MLKIEIETNEGEDDDSMVMMSTAGPMSKKQYREYLKMRARTTMKDRDILASLGIGED